MKTTALALLLALSALTARAGLWVENGKLVWHETGIESRSRRHPLRVIDGSVVELWRQWAWTDTRFATDGRPTKSPLDGWDYIEGTVQQASAGDGMLVRLKDEGRLVFVRRYPFNAVDDVPFSAWAKVDGAHTYKSVTGSEKRVVAYDYGGLPNSTQMQAAVEIWRLESARTDAAERLANNAKRDAAAAVAQKAFDAKAKKKADLDAAVQAFREEQKAKASKETQP